jgi:hypothetical protein
VGLYFSLLFFGGWGICSPCSTAQLQWFWTLAAQCALLPHPHSQLSLEHNLLFTMEVRYCSRRMPSRKLFSVLNGPGLTTTMLWCFFSPLFWNQVLHGGRSAKLSSTYKVAYVWCLNLCEICLSLCVSAGNLQGLHNIQGNYSMQSVQNALPSRNQGMAGGLSTGTHQPTGGRFSSNNLPVGLPQVYAHSSLKRKFSFPPPCSLIILPNVISALIQ